MSDATSCELFWRVFTSRVAYVFEKKKKTSSSFPSTSSMFWGLQYSTVWGSSLWNQTAHTEAWQACVNQVSPEHHVLDEHLGVLRLRTVAVIEYCGFTHWVRRPSPDTAGRGKASLDSSAWEGKARVGGCGGIAEWAWVIEQKAVSSTLAHISVQLILIIKK
jgi:hypothetical protein